ncbi:hypothetical protein ACFWVM_19050 [Nocardia fluminea]|uniref:hypothetical protein n=1 Tax=Nocardia fluminea TaxID=134984 RepID=UPI00366875B9
MADLVGRLDDELREPLSRYLLESQSLVTTQSMADPLDTAREHGVPTGMSSDGTWVWSTYWGYFVREYGIEVPTEFIDHARSRNFEPVLLDDAEQERIDSELEAAFSD